MPKYVNKVGYMVILTAYVTFFIVFWVIAFSQKLKEDAKNFVRKFDDVMGYPE